MVWNNSGRGVSVEMSRNTISIYFYMVVRENIHLAAIQNAFSGNLEGI